MKPVLLILLLAFSSPALTQRREQTCFNYEPDAVTLSGTIKPRTFAGAPNYESVAKGDAREDVWLLELRKPICVAAKGDSEAENDVTEVQLVFSEGQKQYDRYRSLRGRRVTVIGTLFHAETGHHHTKILLTVTDISR
jgi:hypothetical protein